MAVKVTRKTTTRKKKTPTLNDLSKPKKSQSGVKWKLIKDFYDTDYYDYSRYTIERRAIPSIIDGLKPTARKILYTAFSLVTETKETNLMDLVGKTMSYTKYHHGNESIPGNILNLSRSFKDILSPLESIGIFGTLKSPETASPRYLQIKLSQFAELYKQNQSILEYNFDGDTKIEPKYFLPIIPTILTNRTSGVAIGYKFANNMSFNPISIIDVCLEYLNKGKIKSQLVPHINEWTGTHHKQLKSDIIYCKGVYTIDEVKSTVRINEFSFNETFESFEKNLNKLLDTGKILKWLNVSSDGDNIDYLVQFNKDDLKRLIKLKKVESTLKISCWSEQNNLNVLDENRRLLEFSRIIDVLTYFVDFRLQKYNDLKKFIIDDLTEKIRKASELRQFIDLYLKGKIKINNKLTVAEIRKNIESFKLSGDLIETKISKLTKDEYDKLTLLISDLQKELERIKKSTPKQLYTADLNDLKKGLKNEFPFQSLSFIPENTKVEQ